jgi:integrase
MPNELKYTHVPLNVTDKRVAEQMLAEMVRERERESVGLSVPRSIKEAFAAPLSCHVERFLGDLKAKGRSGRTISRYRSLFTILCRGCGWKTLRDVTPISFCNWRARTEHAPKYFNDLHGAMSGMLHWLERQQLLLVNPLKHVEKVSNARRPEHRRALSLAEVTRLLAVAPPSRSWVYLVILYTGLRRHELNRITWADFDLDSPTPSVRLTAADTKNAKPARIRLRPEVVDALSRSRSADAMPYEWVFHGKVPAPVTLRKDLLAAGIAAVDDRGRCVDVHALRTTYGTMLSSSGVSPRVAMELMRHSDLRLTMKIYTDAAQLPLSSEMDKLPSFSMPAAEVPQPAVVVQSTRLPELVPA